MPDLQRSTTRVARPSLWSRTAGHLVVIGLVSIAAAGGLVTARQQADVANNAPGLTVQSFPFSLVALAHASEATQPPIASVNLQLDPANYVPPVEREESGDLGLAEALLAAPDGEGDAAEDTATQEGTGDVAPSPLQVTPAQQLPVPAPGGTPGAALGWPVAGGSVSQYFYAGHLGLDIAAPWGTPVLAAGDGVVTYAGWLNNGGGYVIEVSQSDGFVTSYNHLGGVWVAPGQTVSRGQTIGAVGCTGLCTGPHLHFAVLVGGSAVNPLRYL